MRVFQTTYQDLSGERRTASKWYVEFRNHDGATRRLPAMTDRKASDEFGRNVELLAQYRRAGKALTPALSEWLTGLDAKNVAKLVELGLVERRESHWTRPLADHLADYRKSLEADGRAPRYIDDTIAQVQAILDGKELRYWRDVSASRVKAFIASLREGADPIGQRTYNGYVTAFKGFTNWAVADGRIPSSSLATLHRVEVTEEKERRALSHEEFTWLHAVTENEPERFGMTGKARALLYRLAVETGLRANELRSLTRSSFHLDGADPVVNVTRGSTKNRKGARQQVRTDTAALLRDHLQAKMPASRAFDMRDSTYTAKMIRADAAAARAARLTAGPQDDDYFLAEADGAGRVLDFHALRHTCGVWLVRAGATPREIQEHMRLSSLVLVDRYTRSFTLAGESFVERFGGYDTPAALAAQQQKATGTDGGADRLAQNLARRVGQHPERMDNIDTGDRDPRIKTRLGNGVTVAQQTLDLLV